MGIDANVTSSQIVAAVNESGVSVEVSGGTVAVDVSGGVGPTGPQGPSGSSSLPAGTEGHVLTYVGGSWVAAAPSGSVLSVAGKTGTVTLAASDVGLGNVANVDARARSSHTGTQTASTISDFADAAVSAVTWSTITGKPATFTPATHTHSAADITSGTLNAARLGGDPMFASVKAGFIDVDGEYYEPAGQFVGLTVGEFGISGFGRHISFETGGMTGFGIITPQNLQAGIAVGGLSVTSFESDCNTLAFSIATGGEQFTLTLSLPDEMEANRTIWLPDANGTIALVGHTHTASEITSGTLDIARIPTGTGSTQVCVGNDPRLSDSRTPTSHTHGNISNAGAIGSTSGQIVVTTTSGVLTTATIGSGLTLSGGTLTASGGGGSSVGSDLYLWATFR